MEAVLSVAGLSPLEWAALVCLRWGEYYPLNRMARQAVAHNNLRDPLGEHLPRSAPEYRKALQHLVRRGLLAEVQKPLRAQVGFVPGNAFPNVGCLDFTDAGYQRFIHVVEARRRQEQTEDDWETERTWRDSASKTLHFCCCSPSRCEQWLQACLSNSRNVSVYLGLRPVEVLTFQEPEPVGLWWYRPQRSFPEGWHASLQYRLLRRKRISWPELSLEAWLIPGQHVSIQGTVMGEEFSFGNSQVVDREGGEEWSVTLGVNQDEIWFEEHPEPLSPKDTALALRRAVEASQEIIQNIRWKSPY